MRSCNLNHLEKPNTLLFIDLPNISRSASELNVRIDFQRLIHNISKNFNLKGLFIFTNFNHNNKFIEMLYNLGFTIYTVPSKDVDAYMGFKLCELIKKYKPKVVIIGTHDGDFRGICDELEQSGITVYFIGFKEHFSTFLRCKFCIHLKDLDTSLRLNAQILPAI